MAGHRKKVLIVGAGVAGGIVAEVLTHRVDGNLVPVGFIDDDLQKKDRLIHGLPVLGDRDKIPEIVKKTGSEQIIIAMP
ncbi:MAG: polysaccharide biosynthesis protein, partial [Desulfotomaculaceae bacterium]